MEVRVFGTPDMLANVDLRAWAVVVIDALRMTSVAAVAKANGCTGLRAVAEVSEARAMAEITGALLGGERNALRIEGFDFSNSPLEYTRAQIAGRRLVMTTSNGTRAILAAKDARRVLLGAFVNAEAIARALEGEAQVALLCAGTLGAFTLEDALAAGAILSRLSANRQVEMDDMAIAAGMLYTQAMKDLHKTLAQTTHYRRLVSLGYEDDLRFCLTEDCVDAAPERQEDGWFA